MTRLERWTHANALVLITASVVVVLLPDLLPAFPVVIGVSFAAVWLTQPKLRFADAVTAVRLAGGIVAFVLALSGMYGVWFFVVILAVSETMDFFDGFIARKTGGSTFGQVWDMEIDAVFILLLSTMAWRYGGFGLIAIVPGLYRYVFLLVFTVLKPVPITSSALSWFMKTVCVVAVISLIVTNTPFFPEWFRIFALYLSVSSLGVSFLWETMYYAAHRKASS